MCEDNDMEGARLWFYGGTPPMDEPVLEDQESHPVPLSGWAWQIEHRVDRPVAVPWHRAAA